MIWQIIVEPFRKVWDFLGHDSGEIVSKRGREILERDAVAYRKQWENEEELRKEGAIDFAKWLASDWMSIWVVDKWMWEWQHERTRETFNKYKEYYTEEELYELYLKENNE